MVIKTKKNSCIKGRKEQREYYIKIYLGDNYENRTDFDISIDLLDCAN
jgi:hypothetical protein